LFELGPREQFEDINVEDIGLAAKNRIKLMLQTTGQKVTDDRIKKEYIKELEFRRRKQRGR